MYYQHLETNKAIRLPKIFNPLSFPSNNAIFGWIMFFKPYFSTIC